VRLLNQSASEFVRRFKQELLQAVIDGSVAEALGPPGAPLQKLSPWACPRCGPRLGSELRRNGRYLRRPLVCEGPIELRIPQLICRGCNKSVPYSHPLLPARKRLWLDMSQQITLLYLEGCSYRATRRILERSCRSNLGLMTLWRSFQATGKAPHAIPPRPPARYLGFDEMHIKVRGERRWLLSVRAQDDVGDKHWVGSALSNDRSQEAWDRLLVELGISRYNPNFTAIIDGDLVLEAALLNALPGVDIQRCTWHLKHNAAEWIRDRHPAASEESQRKGLMAAVHAIVDAPDLTQRAASLAAIRPEFPWLATRLGQVLDRIPPRDMDHPVRTNNLLERGHRERRRRIRPMDGFGSDAGAANFDLLWMIKENARTNGRDFLPELHP
jgi:transposase-like protein